MIATSGKIDDWRRRKAEKRALELARVTPMRDALARGLVLAVIVARCRACVRVLPHPMIRCPHCGGDGTQAMATMVGRRGGRWVHEFVPVERIDRDRHTEAIVRASMNLEVRRGDPGHREVLRAAVASMGRSFRFVEARRSACAA